MKQILKNNKGITLIALVITIIILVILAGITLGFILGQDGIIEKANKGKLKYNIESAKERLELIKVDVKMDEKYLNLDNYLQKLEEVKSEYELNNIEKINETNAEVVVGQKYKFLIIDKQNGDLEIIYQGEATELTLSAISGTLTYPNTLTFEVIKNVSGGELSVKSENENIATASIDGNIVTVQSQKVSGKINIIVLSAPNGQYAQQKATYELTVENGTITINAQAYTGYYDGNNHPALTSVSTDPTGTTLRYSLNGGEWNASIPNVKDVNTYTVEIEATKEGYKKATTTITTINISKLQANEVGFTPSDSSWSVTTVQQALDDLRTICTNL